MKAKRISFSPDALKTLRRNKHLTRKQLSGLTDLSQQTIQALETIGANPTKKVLEVLSKELNVVWEIDGRETKKPPEETSEG